MRRKAATAFLTNAWCAILRATRGAFSAMAVGLIRRGLPFGARRGPRLPVERFEMRVKLIVYHV